MRLPVEKKDRKKLFLTIAGGIVLLALIIRKTAGSGQTETAGRNTKRRTGTDRSGGSIQG